MKTDREIGKVVLVSTYSALVELNIDSKSYVKSTFTGTYPIGIINSYVVIPIGSDRIVAMVTKVQMKEESHAEYSTQKMLILPATSRTMWVTMLGTLIQKDGKKEFNFGITRYPELDNSVWLVTEDELDYIFEKRGAAPERAANLISIGTSPIFSNYDIKIDMNRFFGKHAAILGNTGSGKSCTVKAIIEAVMNKENGENMKNAHFIIFDTNNEYEKAFTRYDEQENITETIYNRLVIRNTSDKPEGFFIPHWLMNGRDYEALFTPAPQIQAPILANAISRARGRENSAFQVFLFFQVVNTTINRIRERMQMTNGPVTNDIRIQAAPYSEVNETVINQVQRIKEKWTEFDEQKYFEAFKKILDIVPDPGRSQRGEPNWATVTADMQIELTIQLTQLEAFLTEDMRTFEEKFIETGIISIDTPRSFSFEELRHKHIEDEIEAQEQQDPRVRGNIGTLLLRIDRMFRDPRYKFLFSVEPFENSLSSFLRYIFSEEPDKNFGTTNPPWKEFYNHQIEVMNFGSGNPKKHNITIVDFSNIASDVLENMTALVGRLILEFMQRIEPRCSFPTVLVLEEAHHYIPAGPNLSERQQRAREVFERIAKEGRKYGLSLVVSSQRPSELSRTVLAQCNSFIVHRIQNPDDKEYFKSVMPSVTRDLLDQLPSLAQQTALVVGDCITVPAQVRINDVDPKPDSHDPDFCGEWSRSEAQIPNFENICRNWEEGK